MSIDEAWHRVAAIARVLEHRGWLVVCTYDEGPAAWNTEAGPPADGRLVLWPPLAEVWGRPVAVVATLPNSDTLRLTVCCDGDADTPVELALSEHSSEALALGVKALCSNYLARGVLP